jgi:hypothetical protein
MKRTTPVGGLYHMARKPRLTPMQITLIQAAGRDRVLSRLTDLVGQGRLAASQAATAYLAFVRAGYIERPKKGAR